jgi:hypothetical protein
MNDFTRDELIILKRSILQHVDQFRENSDCIDLMSKIRSMIDNYCEHEFYAVGCGQALHFQCHKCGYIPRIIK